MTSRLLAPLLCAVIACSCADSAVKGDATVDVARAADAAADAADDSAPDLAADLAWGEGSDAGPTCSIGQPVPAAVGFVFNVTVSVSGVAAGDVALEIAGGAAVGIQPIAAGAAQFANVTLQPGTVTLEATVRDAAQQQAAVCTLTTTAETSIPICNVSFLNPPLSIRGGNAYLPNGPATLEVTAGTLVHTIELYLDSQLYSSAAPVNGKAQWTINFTPGPVTIRALCYDPMATGVLTMPIIVE
ncbi:MAG: hypothetical protein KC503_34120 [Myxococcales bacterium]|nr:hypothetical protein [Myxococcales bacterium]